MSDFVPRDILPDLWEEILKLHWTFLETEESPQKIEERKKLEGCLKEFLCVVPHDRKFFLPETADVLRKTVTEMEDFTAYKASAGFEAISQYANNLFTKPWRKEFRVIKMYCGFFQHEVKSNLLDSIKLFEAMGYRQVGGEKLSLEGPICPDQVTNVSRDAMAAYVECQIMKHIYSGLTALGVSCTWQSVFHYREKHTGGASQAIKGYASELQERRLSKAKPTKSENSYATIQHVPATCSAMPPMLPQCQSCAACRHHLMHCPPQQHLFSNQCALHSNNNMINNNSCALHGNNNNFPPQSTHSMFNGSRSKLLASYPVENYQQHAFVAPDAQHHGHLMPHSRSLEYYSEPPPPALPHRHSFDQQQSCMAHQHVYQPPPHVYESPYDCIDGYSLDSSSADPSYAAVSGPPATNCNYSTAYAHPYNVSGNRYPLPYNISSQLNSHYDTPAGAVTNAADHGYADSYATNEAKENCNYYSAASLQQQRSPLPPTRHYFSPLGKDLQAYRQSSFPTADQQHLIDFDECASLTKHDFHGQQHTRSQNNSFDYERERERLERFYEQQQRASEGRGAGTSLAAAVNRLSINSTYAQPKDSVGQQSVEQQSNFRGEHKQVYDEVDDSYLYARPRSKHVEDVCGEGMAGREDATSSKTTDKYLRNEEVNKQFTEFNRKTPKELIEAAGAVASDYRSTSSRRANAAVEATAAASTAVNHGTSDASYESAPFDDFVHVAHTEPAVQTRQLSPTQASKNQDGVGSFESWNYVFQKLEQSDYSKDLGDRGDLLVESLHLDSLNGPTTSSVAANGGVEKRRSSHVLGADGGKAGRPAGPGGDKSHKPEKPTKAEKSILKQSNSNYSATGNSKPKSALKSALKATANAFNNNHHSQQHRNGRIFTNSKGQTNANRGGGKQPPPVATQVIVTSPSEWSCRFCTFLNPNTKRICEMCSKTQDFSLEVMASNTPTCV